MREHTSFGAWLRRRRVALDLTQAALAVRVGSATGTIRKLESEERRPSVQLASVLAEHLDVPADERAALVQIARGERTPDGLGAAPSVTAARHRRYHLPLARDPLIGRDAQRAAVRRLLAAKYQGWRDGAPLSSWAAGSLPVEVSFEGAGVTG